jgi:protein-S-isoprenylcysteine O-methyltransferase Ste14
MDAKDDSETSEDAWRRRGGLLATVTGVLLALLGLVSVGFYVVGVLDVLGEADRSWIFWGLIFLFAGILLLKIGVALFVLGRRWMSAG